MKTYNLRGALTLVTLALLLGGCGAQNNRNPSSSAVAASASISSSSDWRCPDYGVYNLKVPAGSVISNMSFSVCRSVTNPAKFLIDGYSAASVVCFYPMGYAGGSTIQMKDTRKCFNVKNGPVIATFNATDVNYFGAVDNQYTNALDSCLGSATTFNDFNHCLSTVQGVAGSVP